MRTRGLFAMFVLLASVLLANVLVTRYGVVPVGLELEAPAAVYAAGLSLLARDAVQRYLGAPAAVAAILAGAALSALVSPTLALASGVAFLAGESVDAALWTWLQRHSRPLAVLVSGVAGGLVDTWAFLELSGYGLGLFAGMVWAKALVAAAGALVLLGLERRRRA